jgi:DNA-directed RNA polymerase specialized sigma24 family protein
VDEARACGTQRTMSFPRLDGRVRAAAVAPNRFHVPTDLTVVSSRVHRVDAVICARSPLFAKSADLQVHVRWRPPVTARCVSQAENGRHGRLFASGREREGKGMSGAETGPRFVGPEALVRARACRTYSRVLVGGGHERSVCGVLTLSGDRQCESESVTDDEAIFAELYASLRRFASAVRPIEMDADDLVQEALMRTLARQRLVTLDDPGAYLRTAIVRLASNERRSFGRRRRALVRFGADKFGDPVAYPSDVSDLRRLDPADRAAVYLAAVEGRSHREIAQLLGCSEDAARKRVSRGLARLRVGVVADMKGE